MFSTLPAYTQVHYILQMPCLSTGNYLIKPQRASSIGHTLFDFRKAAWLLSWAVTLYQQQSRASSVVRELLCDAGGGLKQLEGRCPAYGVIVGPVRYRTVPVIIVQRWAPPMRLSCVLLLSLQLQPWIVTLCRQYREDEHVRSLLFSQLSHTLHGRVRIHGLHKRADVVPCSTRMQSSGTPCRCAIITIMRHCSL
jgi:hypothetical protein